MADPGYQPAFSRDHTVESGIKEFISDFYCVSDTTGSVDEWLDFFENNATVDMAGFPKAQGRDALKRLRQAMWETASARKHQLLKVFNGTFEGTLQNNAVEYIILGIVTKWNKQEDGKKTVTEWAGHDQFKPDAGIRGWKIHSYQVYMR